MSIMYMTLHCLHLKSIYLANNMFNNLIFVNEKIRVQKAVTYWNDA